jgi:hypothetical protein
LKKDRRQPPTELRALATVSRRSMRRDSTIAQFPAEIYAEFYRRFTEGEGYREICVAVNLIVDAYNGVDPRPAKLVPHLTESAISRWWKNKEGPAAAEAAKRTAEIKRLRDQIATAKDGGDPYDLIMNWAQMTMLKKGQGLERVETEDLGWLLAELKKQEIKRDEMDIKRQRLELDTQRLKQTIAQYQQKLAADNNLELPPASKVFDFVAGKILGILGTWEEVQPLLDKHGRGIAKRLATEAERFDYGEALNA